MKVHIGEITVRDLINLLATYDQNAIVDIGQNVGGQAAMDINDKIVWVH